MPTSKFLFKKARELSFKYSANNVMKATEKDCHAKLMRGEYPVLTYLIKDGKLSEPIETKGTLPREGKDI